MSIALYFGSFNPIHVGHLIIAQAVLKESAVDKVWFVVSPQNPFKKAEGLLPESQRYYLAQLATEDNPRFFVSNIEFGMAKPNYTIDTLVYIQEKYPDKTFSLLMGGDNLSNFHKWKNADKIIEKHQLYVYRRSQMGATKYDDHEQVKFLDVPLMDISSTYIRECIRNKHSIQYLVLDKVREEIEKSRFYSEK